jgi:hypothetical protein
LLCKLVSFELCSRTSLRQNIIHLYAEQSAHFVYRELEAEAAFHEDTLDLVRNGSFRCGSIFDLSDWYVLILD